MKILNKVTIILLLIITGVIVAHPTQADITLETLQRNGRNVTHFATTDAVMIPSTYTEKDTEFRGVWVATVYNLNMPLHTSETQYKAAFKDLVDEMLESNMNAMLFQVRSLNDAFYESDFAPYSRYLTGSEGVSPGWDVMTYMINECHANGIEFHAWLNPYRVANTTQDPTTYLNTLAADNFARIRQDLVVTGNVDSNGRHPIILNPGEPEVKTYIRNVVTEILTNYDVDGIHFDDYFYPYSGITSDTVTYDTYKEVGQTIADWRRENVNDVVQGVKADVDAYNASFSKDVRFGISPFGLWGSDVVLPGGSNTGSSNLSSYSKQYADSKKWVEEGWVHYICPQVYWSFTHSTAPYADVVDWWASIARGTDVDVIIGHAPSSAHSGGWVTEEISDQLRYNQQHPEIKGSVMYSANYLDFSHMQYVETNNWTVTPLNTWQEHPSDISTSITGILSGNIYIDDVQVTLTATDTIWYKIDNGSWTAYTLPIDIMGTGSHVLYMKTIDGEMVESDISSQNIAIQYLNINVPVITITGTKIGDSYVTGSTVTITATEDIYVAINHGSVGDYVLYTDPIVLDDAGSYFIRSKTIDSRGTESEETTRSIVLQDDCYSDPVLTITGAGNDPYYQTVTATIVSDTTTEYKINLGNWITYTTPLVFDTDGDYTLYYHNIDECQVELSRQFTIDTIVPSDASIVVTGEYDGTKYYTTETSITLSTIEVNTTIMYKLHNGSYWSDWKIYNSEIDLLFTANYYIDYKVIDQAGNESEGIEQRIRLKIPASETTRYVIRDGEVVTYRNSSTAIELPTNYVEKTEEIRAIWIATVANIDIGEYISEQQYKNAITQMLDTIEMNNFNTVFFQVRPMNDAFYDSSYAPWSRYLMGTEGTDPGWDVLEFFINECHIRGIEFHAWLNPYRVSTGTASKESQLSSLSDENWAKQNPDKVIADNSGKLILNPGERQVQVYIENVVRELITIYDVDGIHFDDYFYSYNGTPLSADADLYNAQKDPGETLDDWRRDNINTVVREIYEMIDTYNITNDKTIMFGISPFGIWSSGGIDGSNTSTGTMQSYKDQYADSKKWVEEGWVHYILPQLYWEFDHPVAPFADLVDWWANLTKENDVYLIIGHGFYRYSDDGWDNENELLEQLRYISQYDSVIGSSFFSYKTLNSGDTEVVQSLNRLNNYYWTEYVTFPWESSVVKQVNPICPVDQTLISGECVDTVIPDPEPTCPIGYDRFEGGCQLIDVPKDNTTVMVVAITGGTISLGAILFFVRKFLFKV